MSEATRTCVGCGRKAPQRELVRFVAPSGLLERDEARRASGRGAYTCGRAACFERAVAARAFSRTLRKNVRIPPELTEND
jgi:uncharacterized protein